MKTKSVNNTYLALLIVSSLFAYNALAPIITAFYSSGAATSIAIIRTLVLIGSIFALVFFTSRKTPNLLIWLAPYFIFRLVFLARMTENVAIQNAAFYLDATTAYVVFFGFGFIPALAASKFATSFNELQFSKWMNFFAFTFALGLLLNYNVLFDPDAVRVGLYRLNAISLTSTSIAFIIYLVLFFRVSKTNMYLAMLLLPILIGAVVVSKSRGPLVGMFIAFVFYFSIANAKNRRQLLVGSGLLICLFFAGSYFLNIDLLSLLIDRFFFSTNYSSDLDLSGASRMFLWQSAWNQFLDDPVFGRYIFEEFSNYYPHNLFLESLISMGIFGGALFLAFVGVTTAASFTLLRSRHTPRTGLFFALIFYKELVEGMFSGNLIGSPEIWISSCLIVSISLALKSDGAYARYYPKPARRQQRTNYQNG